MFPLTTLIVLLLAIAFLLRIDFIFYIAYVCVGIYAWSRWVTPRGLKGLTIQRTFADHAFLGETVPVAVHVKNNSQLPVPWLQLKESIALELQSGRPLNQAVTLGRRQSVEFSYSVRATRRGYYRIGPLQLSTGDLFGLSQEQRGYLAGQYLTVYPRIIPLTRLGLPSRLPFGTIASNQRIFADPARPMGVRDYVSGDSMRLINWKVSAHQRQLAVKTFQPAISQESAVILNLSQDEYARREWHYYTEWGIEVAASLVAHLVSMRQAVGFMTNGIDPLYAPHGQEGPQFDEVTGRLLSHQDAAPPPVIPPRTGRTHLMKVLERLARIETGKNAPLVEWLPTAVLPLSWGVTLLVLTPQGDEPTCQMLHRFVRAGLNPILIALEPDYNFAQVRQRARHLGFAAFSVARGQDLDQWRRPIRVYR